MTQFNVEYRVTISDQVHLPLSIMFEMLVIFIFV